MALRPDARHLICEGACNRGEVADFDAAVLASGRTEIRGPGEGEQSTSATNLSAEDLLLVSTFRHTWHSLVARFTYKCETCGTTREYGNAI